MLIKMAKINVCDICKKEGKLTETNKFMKVKNRQDLRLDYCKDCAFKIPKAFRDYVTFVYGLMGMDLDDKTLDTLVKR